MSYLQSSFCFSFASRLLLCKNSATYPSPTGICFLVTYKFNINILGLLPKKNYKQTVAHGG